MVLMHMFVVLQVRGLDRSHQTGREQRHRSEVDHGYGKW